MRDRESGFTLIELMVTIAVIAILASIALPSFFGESRKAKAIAEVTPLFNDMRIRLEQYMQENGTYPGSIGESTLHPGVPDGDKHPLRPLPTAWTDVKVRISGTDDVYCGYTWVTGLANTPTNIGTMAQGSFTANPKTGFGFTAPPTDWYYLLAQCDMDGDHTNFSWYFSSSVDPTILRLNEGQ